MSELSRYSVVEVYRVDDSVVQTAGRSVPGDGQVKKIGEGVAIVLAGPAIRA